MDVLPSFAELWKYDQDVIDSLTDDAVLDAVTNALNKSKE